MAQLIASLISIHVIALSNPHCLSYESASLIWFSISFLDIAPVHYMILTANMFHDCRFLIKVWCPWLFCTGECSCNTFHVFAMFLYSCLKWLSVFPVYTRSHFFQGILYKTVFIKYCISVSFAAFRLIFSLFFSREKDNLSVSEPCCLHIVSDFF